MAAKILEEGQLACTGSGLVSSVFYYVARTDDFGAPTIHIDVYPSREDAGKTMQGFQMDLEPLSDHELRVAEMHNNGIEWASRKGIAGALIAEVARVIAKPAGKTLVSSSRTADGEQHSDDAREVWKRLERDGKATFRSHNGRFEYIG